MNTNPQDTFEDKVLVARIHKNLKKPLAELTLRKTLPLGVYEDLRTRYSEPHRYYHTWEHIENMLEMLNKIESKLFCPELVKWAILYHDAVYDPVSTSNELHSTWLFVGSFLSRASPILRNIVRELIMTTKNHEIPDEYNACIIAARGTEYSSCDWTDTTEIAPQDMLDMSEQREKIMTWMESHGFEVQEPKWHFCASYG